jgi:membrane-associated phospholipid phosphatase
MRFSEPLMVTIMALFIGAGLVGFSRLQLNAHSSSQVYCGFLLGFFSLCLFIVWG